MRFVSALILLAAVGVHSFGVNGKTLRLSEHLGSPFASTLPFPSPTALQQARWDRDYRDNTPMGDPRTRPYETRPYDNRNSLTGPPSIYNEAPQSTEAGWWNKETKNYQTTENRLDQRVYSNTNNNNNSPYMPMANVNAERYDVTPDEWKTNSGGINSGRYNSNFGNFNGGSYGNNGPSFGNNMGRPRQILRANDRDARAYEYNNGAMPPYEYGNNRGPQNYEYNYQNNNGYDNQNFPPPPPPGAQYNYGFGGQRGQVVGTYDNNNYDPNDVTPAEWQDSKRPRRDDGAMGPGPGRGNNGMMYNDNYNNNNNNNGYRMNYNGNFNDNGLYSPNQGGNWWTQESKDYRTNVGRQETRSFEGGPMSTNRNGVTPDEWNDYRYQYDGRDRFGMRPVYYKDNVQGPSPQVKNWWDNLRNGFRNVGFNNRYDNNNNYNNNNNDGYAPRYSNNYNNYNRSNRNNNQNFNRNNFVNVGYNNNDNNGYYQDNYVNYDYNNNGYNNNYYPQRYDSYYDDYSRPEYVTTEDRGWWKEGNRKYW